VGLGRVTGTWESSVEFGPPNPSTTDALIAWSNYGIYTMLVDDCE